MPTSVCRVPNCRLPRTVGTAACQKQLSSSPSPTPSLGPEAWPGFPAVLPTTNFPSEHYDTSSWRLRTLVA